MRRDIDFQLLFTPEDYQNHTMRKLAGIAGNTAQGMVYALGKETIKGKGKINRDAVTAIFLGDIKNERQEAEREQAIQHAKERIDDQHAGTMSYGISAPAYLDALQKYKMSSLNPDLTKNVFIAGAVTPETISEADAIVRHVFPDIQLTVVDKEGEDTADAASALGEFRREDLLSTTVPPESIDIVLSDYLLHNLNPNGTQLGDRVTTINAFFKQMAKILKPGGVLIACDYMIPPFLRDDDIKNHIESIYNFNNGLLSGLKKAGFAVVNDIAHTFSCRRSVDRIMLENKWDIPESALDNQVNGKILIATKK